MTDLIQEKHYKGEEISLFMIEKLLPVVAGQELGLVAASMLLLIVQSMREDLTDEELAGVIHDTTAFLVTRISSVREQGVVN